MKLCNEHCAVITDSLERTSILNEHSFNCTCIKLRQEFWKVKNYFYKMQAIQ